MRLKSGNQHQFSRVPYANIPRSNFVRTHTYKTTFNSGFLYPFYVDTSLPGDTFKLKATMFARIMPLATPFMDNLYLSTYYFAVPYRLVWDNFQKFMGEQENPGDSISYLIPQTDSGVGGFSEDGLFDYMGVPTKKQTKINSLHGRAYNLIWNTHFRDQNLQSSVPVPKGDGPDAPGIFNLLRRGKKPDYFTSALPAPQKGASVLLPLGSSAPVKANIGNAGQFKNAATGTTLNSQSMATNAAGTTIANPANLVGYYDPMGSLYADLSSAAAATINAMRQSITLQQFLEKDMRGGTRYPEIILSHFNVHSPDARLQRPEYLGGSVERINVSAVPQTSATSGQPTPQANLAAFGTFTMHGNRNGFTKSFVEHNLIIGVMCVTADLTYPQGLNRMWSQQTRYDFYWPDFAHLGEQAVLNKEIFLQGTAADDQVFGYQERFAEYRYKPSLLTGKLRFNATAPLSVWHLAQDFTTLPVLGDVFISERPPVDRVISVTNQPQFIMDSLIELNCARPMPVYSVPGLNRF